MVETHDTEPGPLTRPRVPTGDHQAGRANTAAWRGEQQPGGVASSFQLISSYLSNLRSPVIGPCLLVLIFVC